MNRCINDVFAYCATTPLGDECEQTANYIDLAGRTKPYHYMTRTCPNDPKNCPYYRTFAERYEKLLEQPLNAA